MGLFCFPKSDSKEDLIKHIKESLDLFSNHTTSTHILEIAEESFLKLKEIGRLDFEKNKLENEEYYKRKETYPLCEYCIHIRYRETQEIDWDNKIYPSYCVEFDDKTFISEMFRKFKDYDENGKCNKFKRKKEK